MLATSSGSDAIVYTYPKTGQVQTEENNWQKTTYTYDALGRVITVLEEAADDSLDYTKAYTYDLAGNRTGFTLTEEAEALQTVTYTYDTLNRLSTVSEDGVTQAAYTYDTNGNRSSLTYAHGVQETYTYNKANWITGLVNAMGEEILSSFAYTYYASGSQQSETDHTGTVTTYTYDDLGRLTQEHSVRLMTGVVLTLDPNGGTGDILRRQSCTYDQDVVLDDPELLSATYWLSLRVSSSTGAETSLDITCQYI